MGHCSPARTRDSSAQASRLALFVLAVLWLEPVRAPADQRAKGIVPTWTVDDVVRSEEASGFQISPDGRRVVWVKRMPDRVRNRRVGHLVLTRLDGREALRLTRGPGDCQAPKWAPDGRHVAFLDTRPLPEAKTSSAEEESSQIWLINPFGGEPWPLTRRPKGVSSYEWAGPDTIVFTAPEEPAVEEKGAPEEKDDTIVVEDPAREPPVRLFRLSIKDKKISRLTANSDRIESFALAPDGRRAVTFHNRSPRYLYDNKVKPVYFLYDLETGARKQVFPGRKFNLARARWTPDGKGFYVANTFTTDPRYVMATVTELAYHDLATGSATRVDLGWEKGLSSQWDNEDEPAFQVTSDGFIALLADGARNPMARYTRHGGTWRRSLLASAHSGHLFGFTLSRDGQSMVYTSSTPSTPTQWYAARLDGVRLLKPVQLTRLNQHLQGKTMARAERVHWKGARDEEVEGLLYYPHGYRAGRKYPLVVIIHGGPAMADFDGWDESWSHPQNLLCGRGAFVFRPNYHGSSNYGLRWAESISGGRYYELEIPDIEKGVDALIARGLVDERKLGVMGRSNGAILTAALTVHTTRYRAASVTAGTVEQASDWGYTRFGAAFDQYYFGKSPFEDPQLYLRKSPFYRMGKVRTPTLICFGADDRVVGPQQGWLHYRALQQLGKVPVRFLLFPGEGHDLERLTHQRRKLREELAWFDRYLFGTARKDY